MSVEPTAPDASARLGSELAPKEPVPLKHRVLSPRGNLMEAERNRADSAETLPLDFIEIFEAQVERTPNALAAQSADVQLSYRELNERANQFGRYFRSLGVAAESLVGVCLPRSAETLAALLGVWKAGGAFLPLDPQYPPERIAFMSKDSGASLLITQERADADRAVIGLQDTGNLDTASPSHALAYVIYTSGSTGAPKGAMITHANVAHYARAMAQTLGITASDRYLHTASFSFSSSVRQFAVPLSCGAAVTIASVDELRDPQLLFERVRVRGISVTDFVPAFSASCLQVLKALPPASRAALLDNRLRLMLSASEPLPSALITEWRQLLRRGTEFINMYGQTETTGIVMTYRVPESGDASAVMPIGRPIANTVAYVLDESRRPVPPGECGELYVGGAGLGRGYINQPEKTATGFLLNPFGARPGERLIRTGDVVRRRPDGVMEFVARSDEQIKVRGFRIEPGEIAAVLRTHPTVEECLVSAFAEPGAADGGDTRKHLVAFVVANESHAAPAATHAASLREFLEQKLPDYMVPRRIVPVDRLPRLPNGKIDRQGLFATLTAAASPASPSASANPLITELTALWEHALGIAGIRPDQNFFALGGDSLAAVALMLAVWERFGRALPLATLFEAGTIEKLAALLASETEEKPWSPLVTMRAGGKRTPLFCIHPGGGNVLGYAEFIAHLDSDLPVYAIQAHGVVEGQEPHTSIPDMAARYLQLIREVQPHGPYYLGGESFGGLIAYEIACQIEASGDVVALVFLGDVWTRNVAQLKSWRYALSSLTYLASLSGAQWREILSRKLLRRSQAPAPTKRYTYADELHQRNISAHRQASGDFVPKPFAGRVALFRARDYGHPAGRMQHYFGRPEMCWHKLAAGGVDLRWIPGTHLEMMHGPNALEFARTLQGCIDRAGAAV